MNLDQENGLKPHFGPFLALIGPILGQTISVISPLATTSY